MMGNSKVSIKVIQADRLIDGCGEAAMGNMAVVIAGDKIREVVPKGQLVIPEGSGWEVHEFPGLPYSRG